MQFDDSKRQNSQQMGGHIISYNTRINVPNIQNTYATKASSIFDSPDQDQLQQVGGSKIYET